MIVSAPGFESVTTHLYCGGRFLFGFGRGVYRKELAGRGIQAVWTRTEPGWLRPEQQILDGGI